MEEKYMNVDGVLKINKEHNKKDILREAALHLARQDDCAADIFDSEFSEAKEENLEYVIVTGKAKINYTGESGYNREETYYENGEKKHRTVTDWKPVTGTSESEERVFYPNFADDSDEFPSWIAQCDVENCWDTRKKESIETVKKSDIKINPSSIAEAKELGMRQCYGRVDLPGDRAEKTGYSGTFEVDKVFGAIVPGYTLDYNYKGESFRAGGFAFGDLEVYSDYPNIAKENNKRTKNVKTPFNILAILSLILGVILNLFMNQIGWWCVLAYVGAYIIWLIGRKVGDAKMGSIISKQRDEKVEALSDFLKRNDLKPLTKKEVQSITRIDD